MPRMKRPLSEGSTVTGQKPVFIVGAGPGASDLITVKGRRALRHADVVFYDALVNPGLLRHAGPRTEKVFVGKRCGMKAMEQSEINRRMVRAARAGKRVVRLKGGDPFIFGRGGEEAAACQQAGLPFEIVPGVSAALGAASYSGIPLTHRGTASSVAFTTARKHGATGNGRTLADLAGAVDTLVIFMGGLLLSEIAGSLVAGNIPGTTPVAVISRATLPDQHTVLGTLESIDELVRAAGLPAPTLIIVGEVTRLSHALNWFEGQAGWMSNTAGAAGRPQFPYVGDSDEVMGESRALQARNTVRS